MYIEEKLVDSKWHYQCQTSSKDEAIERVQVYSKDEVIEFKTCDAVRVIDSESGEEIIRYPEAESSSDA